MSENTINLTPAAIACLDEMAKAEGVSSQVYLEGLLHYAFSCHRRPGSWEAERPFDFSSYDDRTVEGTYADRWF